MKSLSKPQNIISKLLPFFLLALGIFLRCVYLDKVPGGFHRDEAYSAWNAFALYTEGIDSAGQSWPVYFEAWAHGMNALNSYLMLPLIALNGGHMNAFVVRLPQVIVSCLSLVAVYFITRKMFSEKAATLALFLLAICPWHVMMSRWGLESNLAPGFLIFGLCFWIYGLDNPKFLPLSAIAYGLSLYCYATIWPIVPLMLLLQFLYSFYMKKIRFDKWLFISIGILAALALPLMLFLLINMGLLPNIKIGCFSIYRMSAFRSNELPDSFSTIISNIRNMINLFRYQDVGTPFDVVMPYGFFYDIGRLFAIIGGIVVFLRSIVGIIRKKFSFEIFILIQLIGAVILGCLITVKMTQINCIYIPLVLCQVVGIHFVLDQISLLAKKITAKDFSILAKNIILVLIVIIYLCDLVGFQKAYYTTYRAIASAYFQEQLDDAVRFAQKTAQEHGLNVSVNAGLKYPNMLLALETSPTEYLETIVYDPNDMPSPAQFNSDGVTFYIGTDLNNLKKDTIYILYYTETTYFEKDYVLTQYLDWYVAVPKSP